MNNHSVVYDLQDVEAFQEALHTHRRLMELRDAAHSKLATSGKLIKDIFFSLYRHNPTINDEPIARAYEPNREVIEQMMLTTEWRELRAAGTIDDTFNSGLATFSLAKNALDALDKGTVEQINNLHELESGSARLFDEAEALELMADQTSGDRAARLFEQATEARRRAAQNDETAAFLESPQLNLDKIRRQSRQVAKQVEKEITEIEEGVRAFGGYGGGSSFGADSALTPSEKMGLARRINCSHRLKEIVALCGRMKRIALHTQKTKTKKPLNEVSRVGIGRNINRVLPSELALLSNKRLKSQFYLKYAESKLLQYDIEGKEKQGQGPIIVALDSSGSMDAVEQGGITKEAWSKAVTLAILAIAKLQKRDMIVLHFSSRSQMRSFSFPKGQADYMQLLSCTEHFYGGGTAFEPWMNTALQLVQESSFKKADVICVSDGISSVSNQTRESWNRTRKEREMRVYSILIGTDQGEAFLAGISDALLTINNLSEDNQVLKEIFSI